MRALLLAALVAATGCSNLLGLDDPRLADAGTGDPDGPIDGPDIDAPANTVTGRSFNRFTHGTDVTEVPIDLSAAVIQALIPDGAQPTGFRTVSGTGQADGTFTINDVPDGMTYTLKIGRNYYVTSDHTIDQHFDLPTRPGAAVSTGTTSVALDIGSMTPYILGPDLTTDVIDIFSFGVAYQGQFEAQHAQTALAQSFDWSQGFGNVFGDRPLPDAAQNDGFFVFHSRNQDRDIGGGRRAYTTRILDWFDGGNITVADNASTPVQGTFLPATSNRTLGINYTRGAYDSAYPPTGNPNVQISVLGHPWGNDFGWGVMLAQVAVFDWSRTPSPTITMTHDYADPLPGAWKRQLFESYNLTRYIKMPGATSPRPAFPSGYTRMRDLPSGMVSFTPAMQPPGMIRIGGQDANLGGKIAFDGTAPVTLTWSPVATAKFYQVWVWRAFLNGSQTRTAIAATLYTTATSLTIPAEVFAGGEYFVFSVGAGSSPADYAAGELSPNGVPNVFAYVATGLWRLSSQCGNGSLDAGENCDASGEAMNCDVDCTTVQCGDGLRNAAAGEQCDNVSETLGCDGDCTFPICGDGHTNFTLEDCDDGNTTNDGNGCSNLCKFNNACGNGMVEQFGEQCDTGGNSVTCDADCTDVQCGDGYVNTVMEQCDLAQSNGVPGSGCRADCSLDGG